MSHPSASGVLVLVALDADPAASAPDAPLDRELVERLRRGDARAFDQVYAAHHARIFSFLLRLSGRRDTAEDLAQETWLKLARAAADLREDTALAPLLFTIARRSFLSHRRWAMLDLSRLVTFGLEVMSSTTAEPTPEAHHERAREMARLDQALQRIPVASREVLLLVGVEGMEQEDAAHVLGLSYAALRQRLSRARAQLTASMESIEKVERAVALAAAGPSAEGGEPT